MPFNIYSIPGSPPTSRYAPYIKSISNIFHAHIPPAMPLKIPQKNVLYSPQNNIKYLLITCIGILFVQTNEFYRCTKSEVTCILDRLPR